MLMQESSWCFGGDRVVGVIPGDDSVVSMQESSWWRQCSVNAGVILVVTV